MKKRLQYSKQKGMFYSNAKRFLGLFPFVAISSAIICLFPENLTAGEKEEEISFNKTIRPILSQNCFHCHGTDGENRKAGLQLNDRDAAIEAGAIVPGKPEESELISRIFTHDEDDIMPPSDSNRVLSEKEKQLIHDWILAGANYEQHWAFQTPVRPQVPEAKEYHARVRNPIDAFVFADLEKKNRKPAPEASKETLIRRVSLDITGLPPSIEEIDAFLADDNPNAYENLVDHLLNSPRFGERMAIDWLDAARYADTHGFNNDTTRSMWRWRDWVIDAFNSNKPYDEFITEQIAGDLLTNPTLDQRLATAFNRNHVINSEGGIIEEEYRVEYVADRVETIGTVLLGLTMKCSRCHDHKYDPITQKDYFSMFAFFNNAPDFGEDGRVANAYPSIPTPTHEQQEKLVTLGKLRSQSLKRIVQIRKKTLENEQLRPNTLLFSKIKNEPAPEKKGADVVFDFERSLLQKRTHQVKDASGRNRSDMKPVFANGVDGQSIRFNGKYSLVYNNKISLNSKNPVSIGLWINPEKESGVLFSTIEHSIKKDGRQFGKGFELSLVDGKIAFYMANRGPSYAIQIETEDRIQLDEWQHIQLTFDATSKVKGLRLYIDGEEWDYTMIRDGLINGVKTAAPVLLGSSRFTPDKPFYGRMDELHISTEVITQASVIAMIDRMRTNLILQKQRPITALETQFIAHRHLIRTDSTYQKEWEKFFSSNKQLQELKRNIPATMVMMENPEMRQAYILNRGQYDQHGEEVKPEVMEWLLPFPKGAPANRLGFAQWLLDSDHPLTSRVTVNRYWQQIFGVGIVKTSNDFGLQSEWPSNPALLDWLAIEFIRIGWDVKKLYKTILMSSTYRQSSKVSAGEYQSDPENRMLARGARFRLPAELIRDQVLAISGLIKHRLGGPSVYPYQPKGIYDDVVVAQGKYPGTTYTDSTGDDLYRRSLYTFWKRTVPHPGMNTFDAPDREVCTIKRSVTNTPLQALALMNDPIYVEASRNTAENLLSRDDLSAKERLALGFRVATGRKANKKERIVLQQIYSDRIDFYHKNIEAATAFLSVGESSYNEELPRVELAALSNVISVILNLDETISKN